VIVIPKSQLAPAGPLYGYQSSATTAAGEVAAANAETNPADNDDNGTKSASGDIVSAKVTLGDSPEPTGEPATPGHADLSTPDAQSNTTVDFGFAQVKFAVGNYVWNDLNRDDLQTSSEPGINGVVVNLFKADGTPAGTTTTANGPDGKAGFYLFDDLVAGDYYVEFIKPAGTVFVKSTIGADATIDSNVNVTTGKTANFTLDLAAGLPVTDAAKDGAGLKATYINRTIDAGISKKYSIGDLVWIDTNNNSIVDGTEAGIDGVTVELHAANADGTPGALVSTQTTSAGGYYLFTNLDGGDYVIVVPKAQLAPSGPLYGYQSSATSAAGETPAANAETVAIDNDDNGTKAASGDVVSAKVTLGDSPEPTGEPATPGHADLSTPDTQSNMLVDFGFTLVKFAVGNYVWEDVNNDGLQNENGINGLTVSLFKADGTPAGTTTTANGPDGKPGFYLFDDLLAGDYYMVFTKPDGTVFTKNTTGSPALDSNADAAGKTAVFTLNDTLPRATPALEGAGTKATFVLRDIDAGFSHRYTLGNLVWNDENGNSKVDGTEVGIDGVSVELHKANADGTAGALVSTQTTSTGGYYQFTDLFAGDYVVVIPKGQAPLAGFWSSATTTTGETTAALANTDVDNDDNGTLAPNGNVVSSKITLGPLAEPTGEPATPGHADTTIDTNSNLTVDFGFISMSLGNLVWEDTDNNGTRNGTEPVIPGVKVFLYLDSNADGVIDGAAIATTTTNADGQYLFTGLAPGKYIVQIESPAGMYSSSGASGFYKGPFEPGKGDNTASDTQDHGTTVDNRIQSATIMLMPGNEPLAAVESDGLVSALANPASDSNTDLTVDFGLVPGASIGNYVWLDNNRDGIQNEGADAGINGVTVRVIDKAGNVVKTTVTSNGPNGPGYYRFDLIPGDFKIVFDLTTLPEGMVVSPRGKGATSTDSDADPATGMTSYTTLDPREDDPTWDMGVYPTAVVVGNFVWFDANGDGIQNDGPDSGFPGVTVTIYDASGKPVTRDIQGNPISSTQTTDAGGQYLFSNLKPGTYTVKFDLPKDYEATISKVGDSATDSNGLSATSKALKGGQSDLTLDLGLVKPAKVFLPIPVVSTPSTTAPAGTPAPSAISTVPASTVAPIPASEIPVTTIPVDPTQNVRGNVFLDNNRTASKEGSEPGKSGIIVRLLDKDGKVVATTTTDENGNYGFKAEPGDYVVEIVTPNGLTGTTVTRTAVNVKGLQLSIVTPMGLAEGVVNEVAFTGASSAPLAGAALLFLLAGIAMIRIARRKRAL
jgi:SdrD B-like domain